MKFSDFLRWLDAEVATATHNAAAFTIAGRADPAKVRDAIWWRARLEGLTIVKHGLSVAP